MNRKLVAFGLISLMIACKSGDKKAELEALKKQREELNTKISAIETELVASDTTKKDKIPNVIVIKLRMSTFKNFIEVQGKVDADENISISPEMPGMITKINVKVGDEVHQGQILAETDNRVLQQNIADLEGGLELAATMYQKQKNLWDQKIGTEVQYLSAKNQKESLEKKMGALQQQLAMTQLKSPINGTVDALDIKIGQMASPGFQAIRVLNFANLKVKAEVAETFVSRIRKGNPAEIIFPDTQDTIVTQVSYSSRVISPLNRTFMVQIDLDKGKEYQPNMVAIMKIVDYMKERAVVIPLHTIQKAEEGDFIFLADNKKAKKVKVKVGHIYNGQAEILQGLKEGDVLITKGFQELNEGEEIKF